MKRFEQTNYPLNPYSGAFFGLWLLVMVLIVGFRQGGDSFIDEPAYKTQLEEWHQKRVNALKSDNGWLNLIGLFWLNDGKNTLGRGDSFDVSFPVDKAPVELGTFLVEDDQVRFEPNANANVSADGKPVTEPLVIFAEKSKPVTLATGSLRWVVIKRGDKYGIRARDLNSASVKDFPGIERFPIDENWRVKAKFEKPSSPKTIPILNVLGQTTPTPLAGTLIFEKEGKKYRLDAVGEGEKLFILFGDPTNAHETYGAGRFLYADKPGVDSPDVVTLDFNQAINPPCAFTPYATCPLPPKQNKLALAVKAGERRFGDH